jgi:PIN domain nuclease of toxin-antitoxin system
VTLLLDTHALIWFLTGSERLSPRARDAIEDPANVVLASSAAAYEIGFKQRSGRLPQPVVKELPRFMRRARIAEHPIGFDHAIAASQLPGPHRDPWDRLMMAQALADGLTVVTLDPVFAEYGVTVLW